ncbi:hypothetical protein C8Q72DRAFT_332138 [Fomitopsis betulina]|nr:hypothetical protein C8Q72DRAFT_332138 [Fomitopsis betulina]
MAPRRIQHEGFTKLDAAQTMTWGCDAGMTTCARKVGRLDELLEMSVDIILEITRHLHPQDLLSLSWCSKSLHRFFMRRRAHYMWKQSFHSLQWHLPFPEGIIAPAWANLLFANACTGCGAETNPRRAAIWEFNARFCLRCFDTKIIAPCMYPLRKALHQDNKYMEALIPLAVFTPARWMGGTMYLRAEMEYIIAKLDELFDLEDKDALSMFIGKRILVVHRVPKHVARCQMWVQRQEEKYRQDVIYRLKQLGWGDELDRMQSLDYMPLREHTAYQPHQQLTDHVWQTILCSAMIQCMEAARKARLVRERMQVLEKRWAVLKPVLATLIDLPEARAYGITSGDIALMPGIRKIVDVPDDVPVDQASFAGVHAEFSGMVEQWKMDAAIQLRELVMRARHARVQLLTEDNTQAQAQAQAQLEVDVLELATTKFYCKRCKRKKVGLYWPGVLAHACLRSAICWKTDDIYKQFVQCKTSIHAGPRSTIFSDDLEVAEPSEAAKSVIQLCGKNPENATVEEMNALNVMLVVRGGDDSDIGTWRDAIHMDDFHGCVSTWELATPHQVSLVHRFLPEIEMHYSLYICTLCVMRDAGHAKQALRHLRSTHGIAFPSLDHKFLLRKLPPDGQFLAGVFRTRWLPKSESDSD